MNNKPRTLTQLPYFFFVELHIFLIGHHTSQIRWVDKFKKRNTTSDFTSWIEILLSPGKKEHISQIGSSDKLSYNGHNSDSNIFCLTCKDCLSPAPRITLWPQYSFDSEAETLRLVKSYSWDMIFFDFISLWRITTSNSPMSGYRSFGKSWINGSVSLAGDLIFKNVLKSD